MQRKSKLVNRILFVTSSNLATNPRCVKEIQLAVQAGMEVKVLACRLGGWSQQNERLIQEAFSDKVEIRYADVTRSSKINWLVSSFIEKLCVFLHRKTGSQNLKIISYAFSKRSFLLVEELKKIAWIPSLVVSHNPSAFYPAYRFAMKKNAQFAVDVEDYHPGERQPPMKKKLVMLMMQKILPYANYLSYASPLILRKCLETMPEIDASKSHVINNVFWQQEFADARPAEDNVPLRLVWFSQNVDYHRGLEKLLLALDKLKITFTVTLIGNVRDEFFRNEIQQRDYITLLGALSQSELHKQLGVYDIGLAVENEEADTNRAICLTNKIWAYFQAGLYILATRTPAQEQFINQFPQHGTLAENKEEDIYSALLDINKRWEDLRTRQLNRFNSAKEFSWDMESKKLMKIWHTISANECCR
jgi:hypothetical protein